MNSKIVNVIKKGELIFLMEKETKKSLLLITFGVVLFALLMHFSEVIKILQRGVSLTLPIMVHRPFNRNRVYDVRARTCCLGKKHLQCFYGKYAKVVILAAK